MKSKKELSKLLSGLKNFDNLPSKLEQYSTESEIAAESLWMLHMQDKLNGKVIADFGCGTGIFRDWLFTFRCQKSVFC